MRAALQPSKAEGKFVTFFFDADHSLLQNGPYNSPCEQQVLVAIAKNVDGRSCQTRFLRGDILPRTLGTRLLQIEIPPAGGSKGPSLTMQRGATKRSLATVIGDLANSFEECWTSLDLVELPRLLGCTNIFCLVANPMPQALIQHIDNELQEFAPYHGAAILDVGNPSHIALFSKYLLDCAYFDTGKLYLCKWDTGEGVYEFGSDPAKHFDVVELNYFEFQALAPKRPSLRSLSSRGAISNTRLRAVLEPSHFDKVAQKMVEPVASNAFTHPINLKLVLPADEQMAIPVMKLLGYSLNTEHEKGAHKAHVFNELLGIRAEHWRFLAWQLKDGLVEARLQKLRTTEYGIQYQANIQVIGINGQSKTVETGWIIKQEEAAQLTTAFVAEKGKQLDTSAIAPPWVFDEESGMGRWEKIYEYASVFADAAADAYVPTPMKIDGFKVVLEGECGGAGVTLMAKHPFAKWMISKSYARKDRDRRVWISAKINSQSMERALAYAKAFARVLWLNGIDQVGVDHYLD